MIAMTPRVLPPNCSGEIQEALTHVVELPAGVSSKAWEQFLALWGAYQMGWIEPRSGPVNWPQTDRPAEQPPEPE